MSKAPAPPRGVLVALLTPFNNDESLNQSELRNQVDRMISAGVHGIYCLGTNGEFYALRQEEKLQVIEVVAGAANGRVPVVAGIGALTTAESVELAREAEGLGVDYFSAIVPFFIDADQRQIEHHIRDIASATTVPVLAYNIPARTGNSIEPETLSRLYEDKVVVGIKDSGGDPATLRAFIDISEPDFGVYCGSDGLILDGLRNGAVGAVSGMANIDPELVVSIYTHHVSGRNTEAESAQHHLDRLRNVTTLGNPGSMVKRTVELLGHAVGPSRRPASVDDPAIDERIRRITASAAEGILGA